MEAPGWAQLATAASDGSLVDIFATLAGRGMAGTPGVSVPNADLQAELLQEIADQVPVVYGPLAVYPETDAWSSFLATPAESNAEKIIGFRALLEDVSHTE